MRKIKNTKTGIVWHVDDDRAEKMLKSHYEEQKSVARKSSAKPTKA